MTDEEQALHPPGLPPTAQEQVLQQQSLSQSVPVSGTLQMQLPATGGGGGAERHSFVQLFGPVQENSALLQSASNNWQMPSASTSTSMKPFWFNRAWRRVTWASFRVEWRPGSNQNMIRLIHAADGMLDVQQIAEVRGTNTNNPSIGHADVTAALQALGREGRTRNIGWQVRGDGRTQFRVFQVYLEILEAT